MAPITCPIHAARGITCLGPFCDKQGPFATEVYQCVVRGVLSALDSIFIAGCQGVAKTSGTLLPWGVDGRKCGKGPGVG
jgi:hypothetical protein